VCSAWPQTGPGYRSSPHRAGGLVANAETVLADLDRSGIERAVLVGHSYGGGVAMTAAALAPDRVRGIVLVASIGPGSVTGWDRLLAAPVAGPVCAVVAWWLTPWLVRGRLVALQRLRGHPFGHDEWVNWQTWADARHAHGAMWRTFLTEQRDFVHGTSALEAVIDKVGVPSLVLADPADTLVPVATAYALQARLADSKAAARRVRGPQPAPPQPSGRGPCDRCLYRSTPLSLSRAAGVRLGAIVERGSRAISAVTT